MSDDHKDTVNFRLSTTIKARIMLAYHRLKITEGVITGVLKIEGRIIVIWLNYGNPFRTFWWRIARVTDNRLLTVPLCSIHKKSWWLFFIRYFILRENVLQNRDWRITPLESYVKTPRRLPTIWPTPRFAHVKKTVSGTNGKCFPARGWADMRWSYYTAAAT